LRNGLPCVIKISLLFTAKKIPQIEDVMTKADIVERIHQKIGFSKKESAEMVETVFSIIKNTLETGEKIKIAGFGNFVVKQKADRRGRNPQTGDTITIAARRILTFKPSQVLKNAINNEAHEAA
jgi:integration host factor subunit alpha